MKRIPGQFISNCN